MQAEQLVCYWGLWGIRGSDFDPENPAAGSIYPEADPTAEEAGFFEGAINMRYGSDLCMLLLLTFSISMTYMDVAILAPAAGRTPGAALDGTTRYI